MDSDEIQRVVREQIEKCTRGGPGVAASPPRNCFDGGVSESRGPAR